MSWARDPRLPRDDAGSAAWTLGMGPIPDLQAQQHRVQAELEHRFQPLVLLPSVQGRIEEATVPSNAPHSTLAFELRV